MGIAAVGDPVPCRVAGIDLMEQLLALAARKGYRVYILGATTEVLDSAVSRMRSELPSLRLAGYHDGYYADEDETELAASIAAAHPDILFVARCRHGRSTFLRVTAGRSGRRSQWGLAARLTSTRASSRGLRSSSSA